MLLNVLLYKNYFCINNLPLHPAMDYFPIRAHQPCSSLHITFVNRFVLYFTYKQQQLFSFLLLLYKKEKTNDINYY